MVLVSGLRSGPLVGRTLVSLLAIVLGLSLSSGESLAQVGGLSSERGSGGLDEALSAEETGDHQHAARLLAEILEDDPSAVQALLAYERVMRVRSAVAEVLPVLDRHLEAEPSSALGHQLRLRLLSELDRIEELEVAIEDWIAISPELETPYRESARVWRERGEDRRAFEVLELGRSRIGRDDALALELGDVALALGDRERVVEEWARAIGPGARGFGLVRRRLSAASDGGASVVPGLIEELSKGASGTARLRAAVELAIGAGKGREAESIARRVLEGIASRRDRESFLIDVARRAEGARLNELAYWAYEALLEEGNDPPLVIRGRLGALALELGDTAAARDHFRVLEEAYEGGSAERRVAVAVRIELSAQEGEVESAARDFARFRGEYPDAPESDRLAALVAGIFLDRGDRESAERAIAGTDGPRTGLVRGRIALEEGDLIGARTVLQKAALQLEGTEATETIALVTLLRRLDETGGALLSEALPLVGSGQVQEALEILTRFDPRLGRGERGALLEFAAGLADEGGLTREAEGIRRLIVTKLPDSPEAPLALLRVGRSLGTRPDQILEARSYLERLILEHPQSALVPQARRELERLRDLLPQGAQ